MDPVGALLWRVIRPLSPRLQARLLWARGLRQGDAELALVDALVGRGEVVLDVGANFGFFADRLSRLVGPEGHVHAFEPHPIQEASLRRLAGSRRNVTYHPVALSDAPGEAQMLVPRRDGESVTAMGTLETHAGGEDVEAIAVRVETLDRMLADEQRRVAFVKCDVEGHEFATLQGGTQRLERDAPLLLLEIEQRHQDRPIADTFTLLSDLGYEGFVLRPDGPAPLSSFDVTRDQVAYVEADPQATEMPHGYLNDFVFAHGSRPLPAPLQAVAGRGTVA